MLNSQSDTKASDSAIRAQPESPDNPKSLGPKVRATGTKRRKLRVLHDDLVGHILSADMGIRSGPSDIKPDDLNDESDSNSVFSDDAGGSVLYSTVSGYIGSPLRIPTGKKRLYADEEITSGVQKHLYAQEESGVIHNLPGTIENVQRIPGTERLPIEHAKDWADEHVDMNELFMEFERLSPEMKKYIISKSGRQTDDESWRPDER